MSWSYYGTRAPGNSATETLLAKTPFISKIVKIHFFALTPLRFFSMLCCNIHRYFFCDFSAILGSPPINFFSLYSNSIIQWLHQQLQPKTVLHTLPNLKCHCQWRMKPTSTDLFLQELGVTTSKGFLINVLTFEKNNFPVFKTIACYNLIFLPIRLYYFYN